MHTPRPALGCLVLLVLLVLASAAYAEGVVTVAPQGRNLTIRGDAGGNDLTILPGDLASQIRIIPTNGTTLNGFAVPIDFDTPEGTLDVRLDGGDDTIVFAGGVDMGDLLVVLGTGSNVFVSTGSRFNDVAIDGSDLDDEITLTDSAVEGDLDLDLRGGADIVTISGTTAVGGRSVLRLGDGDDLVDLGGTNFGKQVKFDFGAGVDELQAVEPVFRSSLSLTCREGGSDDLLFDQATFLKSVKMTCRADALMLVIRDSDLQKGARVKSGDGGDTVEVTGSTAGKPLSIKTGDGDDTITLTGSQLSKRPALLSGNGADSFEVSGNTFEKGALVNGGRDDDTQLNDIAAENTVNGGKIKVKSVEN